MCHPCVKYVSHMYPLCILFVSIMYPHVSNRYSLSIQWYNQHIFIILIQLYPLSIHVPKTNIHDTSNKQISFIQHLSYICLILVLTVFFLEQVFKLDVKQFYLNLPTFLAAAPVLSQKLVTWMVGWSCMQLTCWQWTPCWPLAWIWEVMLRNAGSTCLGSYADRWSAWRNNFCN